MYLKNSSSMLHCPTRIELVTLVGLLWIAGVGGRLWLLVLALTGRQQAP